MTTNASTAEPTSTRTTARSAGRGGVAVLGAKVFFILTGLVQQTLLPKPWILGLASYGELGIVQGASNILNNVMIATATQGVSRLVARAGAREEEALRQGLRIHVRLAVVAAALFALAAPVIAWFEAAPSLTMPLLAMSGVVLAYGVYAPLVGALNGTARFSKQASLDVTFAVLRTAGLLGVGWFFAHAWGAGVLGATLGFVAAAALIVPLALRATGTGRASAQPISEVPSARAYLLALAPLALAQLFTNGVMQADLLLLGRFLARSASVGADLGGATVAHEWTGVYKACQLFAFLPYQLLFSVTQVLFPLVARAHAAGESDRVAEYTARGARIGALACGAMVGVVAAMPGSLIAFAYSVDVAERGQDALRVLAIGQGCFTMMSLAATVLVSLGREREAAGITLLSLVVQCVACFGIVPSQPFGGAQLVATALATTAALAMGMSIGAWRVNKVAGAFVPWRTAVRAGLAFAVLVAVGTHLPRVGKLLAPIEAGALVVLYVVVLLVTREIGADDVGMIKALVGKKRAA